MNLLAKNTWHTVIHPIRSLQLTTLSVKNHSKNISNFSHKARGILKIIVDTNLNVWIPIWIYHATGFKVTSLFGVPGFIEQDGGPLYFISISLRANCHSYEYFNRQSAPCRGRPKIFIICMQKFNRFRLTGTAPPAHNFDSRLKIVIGNYSWSVPLHWPTISKR